MVKVQFDRLSFVIVDDNSHVRRLLRTILYSFGSRTVFEAEDGANALEVIGLQNPDIVITDLVMPVFDGFDLVRTIRDPRASKNPGIPIIMITGHSEKQKVLEARNLGVSEFLCKPFSANSLYQRVQSIIRKSQSVEPKRSPEITQAAPTDTKPDNVGVEPRPQEASESKEAWQI
jgi:CheY-like chemotaxis protein